MNKYFVKPGMETDGKIELEVFWVEDKKTKEIIVSSTYKGIADRMCDMLNNGDFDMEMK